MAVIALGVSGRKEAVPYLVNELLNSSSYGGTATVVEALGNLEDERAVPVLKARMQKPDFYALSEAFRALIVLGEKEAVPLAIARISPDIQGNSAGFVVQDLSLVTGRNFGFDRQKWERWWQKSKDHWRIPERMRKQFKLGNRLANR